MKKKFLLVSLTLGALLIFLAGCGINQDIGSLKEKTASLEKEAAKLKEKAGNLETAMAGLQKEIAECCAEKKVSPLPPPPVVIKKRKVVKGAATLILPVPMKKPPLCDIKQPPFNYPSNR